MEVELILVEVAIQLQAQVEDLQQAEVHAHLARLEAQILAVVVRVVRVAKQAHQAVQQVMTVEMAVVQCLALLLYLPICVAKEYITVIVQRV
jgi:hypothetical protein